MLRVTGTEVKAIIDTTLTASEIDPFITAANAMIDDLLSGSGLTTAQLKEVERWLSAHLVHIRDPKLTEQDINDASDKYQVGKLGMGLEHTAYGQQAMFLDTTGTLAKAGKVSKGPVTFNHL